MDKSYKDFTIIKRLQPVVSNNNESTIIIIFSFFLIRETHKTLTQINKKYLGEITLSLSKKLSFYLYNARFKCYNIDI